jgi:hypothetical protein
MGESNLRLCIYIDRRFESMSKKCHCCGKETNNPKYCSRSCSAIISNKTQIKRKREGKCSDCGNMISSSRSYCGECFVKNRSAKDITLQEATERYSKHHKTSAYCLVRTRARATEKAQSTTCCEHCGYFKHQEVCHIKPISSYPLTTMISEINSADNLLILCPNCHWEFDHKK